MTMDDLRTALARTIVAANAVKSMPTPGNAQAFVAQQLQFDAVLVDLLGQALNDGDAKLSAALAAQGKTTGEKSP